MYVYKELCSIKTKDKGQPGKKRKIDSSVQFSFGQIMHEKKR